MNINLSRRAFIIASAASTACLAIAPLTYAQQVKEHRVNIYNKRPSDPSKRLLFYPHILKILPGEKVTFYPENLSHNCQSTKGMIPDGAEPWVGPFGKPFTVTPTVPGVYGYHCKLHQTMGMVGLLIVEGPNMLDNLARAKATPQKGRAKAAWKNIWQEVETSGILT